MPIKINLETAIFKWQAKHGERLTMSDLAERTGISEPTLYRMKASEVNNLNLDKLNMLCKVLECDLSEILHKIETSHLSPEVVEDWESKTKR